MTRAVEIHLLLIIYLIISISCLIKIQFKYQTHEDRSLPVYDIRSYFLSNQVLLLREDQTGDPSGASS